MRDHALVSVIIPTRQRRELLRRTLASLAIQTAPPDEYEVVVAIDGANDGTREMMATFDAPYELQAADSAHQGGRAAACNAAFELTKGDVVIILDDDMQVVPQFVDRHRRHHPPGSRVCVLGAVPVTLSGSSPLAARYVRAKFDVHLSRLADPEHVYQPRDFYSGNASLRSEVLREVGGYDDAFTDYGNEDVELWVRLRAADVKFRFDAEARALQEYDKSLRALGRDTVAKGRSAVRLTRSHPGVFGALRLAAPRDSSRPWLSTRATLLAASRRYSRVTDAVLTLGAALERFGLWRWSLFYRALLDYAFWAGVDSQLVASRDDGDLARLAAELHRGPIDLLLHG